MLKSYFDQHLPKRIILSIIVAFAFILIPRLTADFYYHYIDGTNYVIVSQPVSVDKKAYKPCDKVVLVMRRSAQIDVNISYLTQLVLLRQNGDKQPVKILKTQIPVHKTAIDNPDIFSLPLMLPCDLEDGQYFWQANGTYSVKGYEHTMSFITESFNVYQSGISPNTQNIIDQATSSGELK